MAGELTYMVVEDHKHCIGAVSAAKCKEFGSPPDYICSERVMRFKVSVFPAHRFDDKISLYVRQHLVKTIEWKLEKGEFTDEGTYKIDRTEYFRVDKSTGNTEKDIHRSIHIYCWQACSHVISVESSLSVVSLIDTKQGGAPVQQQYICANADTSVVKGSPPKGEKGKDWGSREAADSKAANYAVKSDKELEITTSTGQKRQYDSAGYGYQHSVGHCPCPEGFSPRPGVQSFPDIYSAVTRPVDPGYGFLFARPDRWAPNELGSLTMAFARAEVPMSFAIQLQALEETAGRRNARTDSRR